MPDYQVVVHNIPGAGTIYIGDVTADSLTDARQKALTKYGEEGLRPGLYTTDRPRGAIYEDDKFDVRQRH